MYDALENGIYKNREKIDKKKIDEIARPFINSHVEKITNAINAKVNLIDVPLVRVIGGGVEQLEKSIEKYILRPEIVHDSMFYNAKGFKNIANAIFNAKVK
jgi:predicted NBD/HSP70 family sugar kinase